MFEGKSQTNKILSSPFASQSQKIRGLCREPETSQIKKYMFNHLSHDIESGYQKFDSNVSYCHTASLCQAASLKVYMLLYVVLWCFVIGTL